MPNYTCKTCNKLFKQKTDYTRHINRKYPCKSPVTYSKNGILIPKMECSYCHKTYSTKYNLNKHHTICKCKKESDNKDELLKKLLIEKEKTNMLLEKQQKQINKLNSKVVNNNINITNTNTNNITLLPYGKSDLSHITNEDYRKIINTDGSCHLRKCSSLPLLIEKIHYSKEKPENRNIYIKNIKEKYVAKWDGTKWCLEDSNDALDDMFIDGMDIFYQKTGEWKNDSSYQDAIKSFDKFLEIQESDNELINVIKQRLKLLLYNNREG